ncbi:MAG: cupin domain-containing protein [Spirochaetaceae bacterium]|jgi:mannose-6-phosphate isomerase-like protein (cupin superfamily)|nr:cupin domain-containing protein [Spirochaetaceae bacterium]
MVIHRNEMRIETKEKMRGGEGAATLTHLLNCEKERNIRMLAEITLPPGASIGKHSHEGESEYFIILSGTGTVSDNGADLPVKPGDATATGGGAFHSITNTGTVPLIFYGIVVTY